MHRIAALIFLVACAAASAVPAQAQPQDVMTLIRGDRWADADLVAGAYADPVVRKLVTFYRLLAPMAGGLDEITRFIADSPDWPMQATLLRRRDEALVTEPDDVRVIVVCDRAHPAAAAALARCADAFQHLGRAPEAQAAARAAWIAAAPDAGWEGEFLPKWAAVLGPAEQAERFDRVAWGDPAAAARLLGTLAAADRPLAEARLALRRDDPNAEARFSALPEAARADPALFLERARWLRRAARDTEALALWQAAGAAAEHAVPPEHLPAFWDERNILVRHRLRDGDAAGAYALADGAFQTAPEQVTEAGFLAGWIALRRLQDFSHATAHFAALTASSAGITLARGHYWLGRTARAAGNTALATHEFAAAAAWPNTYYGQLASLERDGGMRALAQRILAQRDPGWDHDQAVAFAGRELARASAYLVGWGEKRRAQAFLLRLSEVATDPTDLSLAAHLAQGFGMPETAVALARKAGRGGVVLLDAGWPVAADIPPSAEASPDAGLALGVIRQESSFDSATTSPVGARGLMQLMPGTAATESRRLALPVSVGALTASPAYNIQLGTSYLRGLLDRFAAAEPLAIAGYNAGPARVDEWLATNGDPRGPGVAMIDWIELIPFAETRNYVQRVVENTVIYRAKLNAIQPHPVLRWQQAPA